MKKLNAEELIAKYLSGVCTSAERTMVEAGFLADLKKYHEEIAAEEIEVAYSRMRRLLPKDKQLQEKLYFHKKLWQKASIAASLLIFLGFALYLSSVYFGKASHVIVAQGNDILPGRNGATLTLANGEKITISDSITGQLAEESGVSIIKDKNGQVNYIKNDSYKKGNINTLETAIGQQSSVKLPDGSIVYLNAASKLVYPTSFSQQKNREVELSGEGFFEIAKDAHHPFIVKTTGQEIEVLGTHFNLNSYANEPGVITTLMEGRIKITVPGLANEILEPGDQATLRDTELNIRKVETEYALSWKNGYFMFDHETLDEIMTKLARWYNVKVVYRHSDLMNRRFFGSISKYENVSKILEIMEKTNVANFTISGNTIFIDKK